MAATTALDGRSASIGRRGNPEEQYGHVNWSSTLREKVWDDQLQRYVGINPAAEAGTDGWRSPAKKRRPQSAMALGTRGLSGSSRAGSPRPSLWESTQLVAANAQNHPHRQVKTVKRSSSGAFSRRSTMDPANPEWSMKHTLGRKRPSTAGRVQHVFRFLERTLVQTMC